MRSISRKRAVVVLICGALLCIAFCGAAFALSKIAKKLVRDVLENTVVLEMQVGEEYDLKEYLGQEGAYSLDRATPLIKISAPAEGSVSLDGQGVLLVREAGVYDFTVSVYYENSMSGDTWKPLVRVRLIAYDYEYEDYTRVTSYLDLAQAYGGKYILAGDLSLKRYSEEEVLDFSGILVNPNGYKVNIYDGMPLFNNVGEGSILRGLNVVAEEFDRTNTSYFLDTGILARNLEEGVICDCTVEANVYGTDGVICGVAAQNSGIILHSEFRGTWFDLGYELQEAERYGIAPDGEIYGCKVYADGYFGSERVLYERASVYLSRSPSSVLPGQTLCFSDTENRTFDLSGEHEIDYDVLLLYKAGYAVRGGVSELEKTLCAGSVAQFPRKMGFLLQQEGAEFTGYTDSNGGLHTAEEAWFLPETDEIFVSIDAKYRSTELIDQEFGTLFIRAAEDTVEIPDGIDLGYPLSFGMFSPAHVTLVLAENTQVKYDTMFVKGVRDSASAPIEVSLDIGASKVYEQRADGVYRTDDGKLCRYEGEVRDGVITLPDGVTIMSGDPFGNLQFHTLDTNKLITLSYISESDWVKDLRRIRFGSVLDLSYVTFDSFSSLEYIETENRTDKYFALDGILYKGEGIVSFVPCSYAAGATLTLSDAEILSGALSNNRAKTIIFVNAKVRGYAVRSAECSEVIVRGSGTSFSENAFYNCHSLISFRADGIVSLASSAIYGCNALESVELNQNIDSIFYDTVENCYNFLGYTQAEGCEKFVISNGVLFVGGKALVTHRWLAENKTLSIPNGIAEVKLYTDYYGLTEDSKFTTLRLSADLQNLETDRFPATYYEVDEGNEYFSAQDGVLFSADGTRLIAYPIENGEMLYSVPDSVTEIGEYAFAYAEKLQRVILGENTQVIGEYAFQNVDLINVIYNSALKTIERYAFFDANLAYVDLPDSLETLEEYAFYAASVSTQIRLSAGIGEIKKSVFENASIKSIDIPEGITSVGEDAFAFSSLKEVSLPQSLLSVGENAFRDTLLERVALGKNVQEVGTQAFYNCTSLAEVTAENSSTEYGDDCFKNSKFLKEGKTATEGAIYLGNTLFSLFGEGESAEVKYGTTRIFSLESVKVKTLKLPATLSEIPSVEGLPYLEELWLGVAPQGAAQTNVDVGSVRFRAKADHLYIRFPKYVTFSGELGEDVYFCYDGTQAEFEQFAHLENAETYADRIYYRDVGSQINVWDVDEQGRIRLHAADAAFSAGGREFGNSSFAADLCRCFGAEPAQNIALHGAGKNLDRIIFQTINRDGDARKGVPICLRW